MAIDHAQTDPTVPSWGKVLKKSHRPLAEQLVGLGIYLSISFGVQLLSGITTPFLGSLYSFCLALSMWTLWRKFSLRVLKLELSLFLAQFLFQIAWSFSHFALNQVLLSLVALLLLWCNTLVAALLYWRKEHISGLALVFPLILILSLVGINMVTCISNP
jgi:hypothetical protein